jgi:hypothetical protein
MARLTIATRYTYSLAPTAQKTSLPLLCVLSLPGIQRVHRAVPYKRLLYCRLFTQLLGNGSTCHVRAEGLSFVTGLQIVRSPV